MIKVEDHKSTCGSSIETRQLDSSRQGVLENEA